MPCRDSRSLQAAVVLAACLISLPLVHAVPAADEIVAATSSGGGLAVHVGAVDATLGIGLARRGGFLVHLIPADPASVSDLRTAIAAAGCTGLISVERMPPSGHLPFATRGVDLLVADTGGNPKVTSAEINRVMAPGGAIYTGTGQTWTSRTVPFPKDMDDWSHFRHDSSGRGASADRMKSVPTSLKFIAGVHGNDIRVQRDWVVEQAYQPMVMTDGKPQGPARGDDLLIGRHAFTGVAAWYGTTRGNPQQLEALALSNGMVFHLPGQGPAEALDAKTGKRLRVLDKGISFANLSRDADPNFRVPNANTAGVPIQTLVGNTLLQAHHKTLAALDPTTGELKWKVNTTDYITSLATLDGKRLVLIETSNPAVGRSRWGARPGTAISCYVDGKLVWRKPFADDASDIYIHGDNAYVVNPGTNMYNRDEKGQMYSYRLADGEPRWSTEVSKKTGNVKFPNSSLNNAVFWNNAHWAWGPFNNLMVFDDQSGAMTSKSINGYNQRCVRTAANADWLVFGLTSWVAPNGEWYQTSLARGNCSVPPFLAHGQAYFGANLVCSCINGLRGVMSLQPPDDLAEPATDKRLERDFRASAAVPSATAPEGSAVIRREWQPEPRLHWYIHTTTEPVETGGMRYVADVHTGVLTATRDGKAVWTFAAGGRIQQPPALIGDKLIVGSCDGWATCLDAKTGKAAWRFLAAPVERYIVAYGQLESASPVYGVAAHDGLFYVSAGRHAELDGGIALWGLDPASGATRFSARLKTDPSKAQAGSPAPRGVLAFERTAASNTLTNGGLQVHDGKLIVRNAKINKYGSSISSWGYFMNVGGADSSKGVLDPTKAHYLGFPIESDWNGKTIDPQSFYPESLKKKK